MTANRFAGRSEGGVVARLESEVCACFQECVRAFAAFADLDELAENLRVLSLNAELAAGRAGGQGRAVRVLTQHTRELVGRLTQARHESSADMRATYKLAAELLRALHSLRTIEAAAVACRDATAAAAVEAVRIAMIREIAGWSARLGQLTLSLTKQAAAVEGIAGASESIATNIAIEAAGAGQFEPEFRNVAATMRGYVGDLRGIMDEAGGAVRRASGRAGTLRAAQAERAA